MGLTWRTVYSRHMMQPQARNVFRDEEISIAELFQKLMSHKWYVLVGYAVVLAGVAFYTYN